MRTRTALRRRSTGLAALAALAVLGGLAVAVPGASGGFTGSITNSTDTAGTAKYFKCFDAISPDLTSAYFEWPLSDQYGAISTTDLSGNSRTATFVGTTAMDASAPLGCPRDGGSSWRLDGSTNYAYSGTSVAAPNVFTLEVYFQTSTKAGALVGFGSATTGASSKYDRMLYINTDGGVSFGVYNGGYKVLTSAAGAATDGAWHHVAGVLSTSGMKLYLDGRLVASDASTTAGEANTGYWHAGYNTLATSWPKAPSAPYFNGRMRGVGVYTAELTAAQIANHAAGTFGS